jgi:hypothetical protein
MDRKGWRGQEVKERGLWMERGQEGERGVWIT